MTPLAIAGIATDIQLIISAAQYATPVVIATKTMIDNMFKNGLIDAATQNALHAHVDALMLAAINQQTPPSWTVEPDPA